ncbi:MAG TPA: hypothetical protein VNM90_23290 [Haliangium sp.]|nr:hypothetical protein [Haliangium sp.]
MSVRNSVTVTLVSFIALSAPSCVLSDGMPEDSGWEHAANEELSDDAVFDQDVESALEARPEYELDAGDPYSCVNRYCVYGLNGDSSLSFYDCFQTRAEADAYRDSHVDWKVVAGFDTQNGRNVAQPVPPECNGTTGNVRFLIRKGLECTPTRNYEVPSLVAPAFGTMNDTFISAIGNSFSGCARIRVWEHASFNGYFLACRSSTGWCPTLDIPPLYLGQTISSLRALYE